MASSSIWTRRKPLVTLFFYEVDATSVVYDTGYELDILPSSEDL
jgi:hypothetical protein